MTTGELIRYYRQKLNMTQEELAAKMGYAHKSSINKIEIGKNDLPQHKLIKFAKCLEVSPIDLLPGGNEPKTDEQIVKNYLFGKNAFVTDEMLKAVVEYAQLIKEQERARRRAISVRLMQDAEPKVKFKYHNGKFIVIKEDEEDNGKG